MNTPPEQKILPPHLLLKGPDAIRGTGHAFILTKYPDPQGNRWFLQPGHVGHETMTSSRGMLQALFGPDAERIADEVITLRDVYANGPRGFTATGEKKEDYDYHEIRRQAKVANLFGRSGTLANRSVVMLWNAPENWQQMTVEVLRHLESPPDTIVTVGASNQFLSTDFMGQADDAKKAQASRVDADQVANKDRLELLAQYHTATGPRKWQIAQQLGLHKDRVDRPGSPADWRAQGRKQDLPYVYSYGERRYGEGQTLQFREFLQGDPT